MSQLLTALLTIAAALGLLVVAVTPRRVWRRRGQVARFIRRLDDRLRGVAEPTTWKARR